MSKKLTISKALKILYDHEDILGGHDDYWNAYRFIEKHLTALEIIKEKMVDVNDLLNFFHLEAYNKYVMWCADDSYRILTEEEYNLLKEVLL